VAVQESWEGRGTFGNSVGRKARKDRIPAEERQPNRHLNRNNCHRLHIRGGKRKTGGHRVNGPKGKRELPDEVWNGSRGKRERGVGRACRYLPPDLNKR